MKRLNYNYVIFNSIENKLKVNENGYYTICLNDLKAENQVECVNLPLEHLPLFIRLLYKIHHSAKLNKYFNIPFKKLWYPFYHKIRFTDNKPICFIVLERIPISYLLFLKKKYPNSKYVALYRDLRRFTEELYPDHPDNPIFDFQMTIDEGEAKKYGYYHFEEFESKLDIEVSNDYPLYDIFFAGKGKDRLPRLLEAYDILTRAGLKVFYYITHVDKSERVKRPGIVYADRFMPYSEMLYHSVNAKCILEINQYEAVGFTSRFLEAVMYNKRLITDNQAVKKSKFYKTNNILCISDISDIQPNFVKDDTLVDYSYQGEFSPVHLIERIDLILSEFEV